jgi:hypothetical protein
MRSVHTYVVKRGSRDFGLHAGLKFLHNFISMNQHLKWKLYILDLIPVLLMRHGDCVNNEDKFYKDY